MNNLTILLATTNKDKYRDFQLLLTDLSITLTLTKKKLDIQETEDTLIDNAKLKACTYSKQFPSKLVLATDGGTKIPYLGDSWNHVLTKRLSGRDMKEELTNRERCSILLDMLKNAKGEERKVFWCEAFVIAHNSRVIYTFEAQSPPGYLLKEIPDNFKETGYGVGYIWYKPEYKKTYMQLTKEEKKSAATVGSKFKEDLAKKLPELEAEIKNNL